MSWNILIYKESGEPLGDLASVTKKFSSIFRELEWNSAVEAELPVDRGFILELTVKHDMVQDIYTNGGYDHLKDFARLCKKQGCS